MSKKIDRTQLQILFSEALDGASFTLIDGLNPFHVEVNGKEYYIYIKNLSPAYFTNPDVWRVQLPIRDDFDEIKETDVPFILLGYDADYDVYTTWNPVWTKQRLNVAESVSFYSRRSLQEEVNRTKGFKRQSLNNDGEVVAFPRELLRLFFASYTGLFTGSGNYVAMGSKKRTEANDAYKQFTDSANVPRFAKYMDEHSYAPVTINNYTRVIKRLISEGIISRSRKVFLACDKLEDYMGVIDSFVNIPEVKEMNEKWHHLISAALRAYITFLLSVDDAEEAKDTEPEINFEAKSDLYKLITDSQVISGFSEYLSSGDAPNEKVYNRNTINHYIKSIISLKEEGHFERHRDIFSRYDAAEDLQKAFKEFLNCTEINRMNIEAHHDYSASLKQYAFYINQRHSIATDPAVVTPGYALPETSPSILQAPEPDIQYGEEQNAPEEIDWEARYTNSDGKLTKIANPELLDQLRPFLDTEYRELSAAYNVIDSFYGDRFKNMDLSDWGTLINKIDWNDPYVNLEQEDNSQLQEPRRKKNSILRVEFPDGKVIQHPTAADTLAEVINTHYPDLIAEIGITHANVPLVSKVLDAKYADYQKPIDDGWYVFTNTRTEKKRDDLLRISKELDLGLKVDVVIPDNGGDITTSSLVEGMGASTNRAKIKVQFPDGRILQPNKVLETLVEVVKFAGPEKVRALNINVCGDNLITKNPLPRYVKPCKPVGDGWLCNTCSDTLTKLEQIQYISEKLNLGIVAELV